MRWLGYIWAAPMALIGLLVGLAFKTHTWAWDSDHKVLAGWCHGFPGPWRGYIGLTLGWVVLLDMDRWHEATVRHELVHVRQSLWLGPLVLLAYPLASLWAVISGGHWYRDNAFERHARREAGQKV